MSTTEDIITYKRAMRDVKFAEAQECLRIAGEAAETVSGSREKHHGAMEVVGALAKHLKNLNENG